MKEYYGIPVSSFSMYRNIQNNYIADAEPLLCVVPTHSIHSHCLLMPFKEQSYFLLQIIHPTDWANEFLDIS